MARIEHLLRLAAEIAAVSRTVEADLTPFRSLAALEALQSRARRMRLQAEATLATRDRLLDLPWFELESRGETMHVAHFRMVALRATVDVEISNWRKHVRRGVEAEKSTWPFVTTPMSSSFDARPLARIACEATAALSSSSGSPASPLVRPGNTGRC